MTATTLLATFFEAYASAALRDDPHALAAMYAPTFLVAGPKGSQAFANDGRFLDWLREVRAFNQKAGMTSLRPIAVDQHPLSQAHTLATVT